MALPLRASSAGSTWSTESSPQRRPFHSSSTATSSCVQDLNGPVRGTADWCAQICKREDERMAKEVAKQDLEDVSVEKLLANDVLITTFHRTDQKGAPTC